LINSILLILKGVFSKVPCTSLVRKSLEEIALNSANVLTTVIWLVSLFAHPM